MVGVSQTGGTLLDKIVDAIIPPKIVAFLNQDIFVRSWIWINYWSFVHFFAGVGFFFLFPTRIWIWVIINVVFEITEYLLAFGGHPLFVEEFIDIIWDLVFSIGGFLIAQLIFGRFMKFK
ncbi:hypothetical protein HOA55_00585 [archaeon]|jgi:hypothetical protein|nr:hypothetical protein [archaeon]MBT3578246.1 hypothetical protein [archaeon]MBT6819833.1 hypothetical protein [archaeon]MBT6956591.1 hypothetical protein [archaeon]MBT7025615.1 hypothetical protein [archaeon]